MCPVLPISCPSISLSPGVRSFKLTPPSGVLLKSLAVAIRPRTRTSSVPKISGLWTFRFVGWTSHFPEWGVSILHLVQVQLWCGNNLFPQTVIQVLCRILTVCLLMGSRLRMTLPNNPSQHEPKYTPTQWCMWFWVVLISEIKIQIWTEAMENPCYNSLASSASYPACGQQRRNVLMDYSRAINNNFCSHRTCTIGG